jgi:hypothetical protein
MSAADHHDHDHASQDRAPDGERKKERYVHRCSSCGRVLDVRKDQGHPATPLESLHGVCPGRGAGLECLVGRKPAQAPQGWQGGSVAVSERRRQQQRRRRRDVSFQSASSRGRFAFDFVPLDRVLQPLAPGNLIVLSGPQSSAVVELAAFRAQLPKPGGGLDSTTLVVDGGNCSDPYLFASFAKAYGHDEKKALRRVAGCRVFTMYQLAGVVSRGLARMAEEQGASLVVIAGILGTFNEPEVGQSEVTWILGAIEHGIAKVRNRLTVIVTLPSPNRYDDLVASWADTHVAFSASGGGGVIVARQLKHPSKKRVATSEFRFAEMFRPGSPNRMMTR